MHDKRNTGSGRAESSWQAGQGSGLRECAIAVGWAMVIALPIMAGGGLIAYRSWTERESNRLAALQAEWAYERVIQAPAAATLPVESAANGRDVFATTCFVCHGPEGRGVAGLGRNLVESDFVARSDDDALAMFLLEGRPDASPAMPPKGGRDDLTEADLRAVVSYLRGLQDPRRLPALPAMAAITPEPPSEAETAQAMAAAGGDPELAAWIASGSKIFASTCIACHGPDGVGVKGNGKPLNDNAFVRSLDDDALLAFIKRGRDPSDPQNTTGVGMPAKGGNPALSDDDFLDVISYLRSLQPSDARAQDGKD